MAQSALALVVSSTFAHAQSVEGDGPITIIVDGVAGCPSATEILGAVETRLAAGRLVGPEPAVTISIGRERDLVVARVALGVADSDERRFEARSCSSVARALTVFLVIALARYAEPGEGRAPADGPGSAGVALPVATARPVVATASDAPAQAEAARNSPADHRPDHDADVTPAVALNLQHDGWTAALPATTLGVGVLGHVGLLPAAGSSVAFDANVGDGRWTFALGGLSTASVSKSMAGGEVVASMVAFTAGPCLQGLRLAACAMVTVGRMNARGQGFAMSSSTELPSVATGVRVVYEVPLGAGVSARIHLDANGAFTRARLAVTGAPAAEWTSPPGWLAAGISLAARIL